MKNRATAGFALAVLVCMIPAAGFALDSYSQDFEGLNQADTGALAADGWLVFGNVFAPDFTYLYGYGPFPAPNDGAAFCAIASGEGGAEQGTQQLSVFSDYNNGDHATSWIESNVFQEQTISLADLGTWTFEFQSKLGNLEGETTALAFIKTLDPDNGFATTNFITEDMTMTPVTWTGYSISIEVDAGLEGQILQFGFASTATNFEGSGVFYDNINFQGGAVATEGMSWGGVKTLYR